MNITSCHFSENVALLGGAGGYILGPNYNIALTSCNFIQNWSPSIMKSEGGGLYVNGENDHMTISFCSFTANIAHSGAGLTISRDTAHMTLASLNFTDNTASLIGGQGGGMLIGSGNVAMILPLEFLHKQYCRYWWWASLLKVTITTFSSPRAVSRTSQLWMELE